MTTTPMSSPGRALAAVTSSLLEPYDVTDVLARMLTQTTGALRAKAAGLLVVAGTGSLELLASTSHEVSELEIYQAQSREGPCIDCVRLHRPVSGHGSADMVARWPEVGPAIIAAGFSGVHAEPLRWRGRVLGGLNLFFGSETVLDDEARSMVQAFTDIATLALVQTQAPSDRELMSHVRNALDGRILVEHAKGVLVETQQLDPAAAYTELTRLAKEQQLTITEMAQSLVSGAQRS